MPIRPCPVCQQPTVRWLEETSKDAVVNYYRCSRCNNVWTIPKEMPDAQERVITSVKPPK
jgi:hypothetical protein